MAKEPKKTFKYAVHLAATGIKNLEDFLTETALTKAIKISSRDTLPFESQLFVRPMSLVVPEWADRLDIHFEIDGKVRSASSAGVLLLRASNRVLACTFGHGHTMLDDEKKENDFGLLVAANSLSDKNVRLVEKANLGSVIRDATQAAGITKLQEFNVDRALSLVRKLSGNSKDDSSALSGSASVTITSEHDINELHKLCSALVGLYSADDYKTTAFAIIDKIKPVASAKLIHDLDASLVSDLSTAAPAFELGAPEIDTQPIGYLTISGIGVRKRFADVTLATYLSEAEPPSISDLHEHKIVIHNAEGTQKIKDWSVYRGLVGSLEVNSVRYALNEGKWYQIDGTLRANANASFTAVSKGLDTTYVPWPVIGKGKDGKTPTYEIELAYNTRVCALKAQDRLLFDQNLFAIPGVPGQGIEICDIFDIPSRRLIHVKKSGRRSSVISHFLTQGINSAKALRTYGQVKEAFLKDIEARTDATTAQLLRDTFPQEWTVEYKFGDAPTLSGGYTIPFFSRVTLDEVKREIEALGYKGVEVSFIRLSKA